MKKLYFLFFIIPFIVNCSGEGGNNNVSNEENPSPKITVEDINKMHASLKESNIDVLKKAIQKSAEKSIRERAIFVLSDIAIKNDKVLEIIPFLENTAKNNPDLRPVIYANLDLLRDSLPKPIDIDVRVKELIKKGKNITLTFYINSRKPSEILVVLRSKFSLPDKKPTDKVSIVEASNSLDLKENLSGTTSFKLKLEEKGLYGLKFIVIQKVSKTENYRYKKYILLDIKSNTGSYRVY